MRILLCTLLLVMSSCASSSVESEHTVARDLSEMTLIPWYGPNKELLGYYYPFRVCTGGLFGTGLGQKCKLVRQDFSEANRDLMARIEAMDFVCKVREKP